MSTVAGVVLTSLLGALVMGSMWTARHPPGAAHAFGWGLRHGLLVGAAGIITGPLVTITVLMLPARHSGRRRVVAIGAALGAFIGVTMAVVVAAHREGPTIGVGAAVAHVLAGALIADFARVSPAPAA